MAHDAHTHGPDCDHNHDDHDEIDVVELEDENGEKEEFAILEEVEFEGRNFAIMAPLAEVQAYSEADEDAESEPDLTIEIFEVKGDDFSLLEDEALGQRLLEHLDAMAEKLENEQN